MLSREIEEARAGRFRDREPLHMEAGMRLKGWALQRKAHHHAAQTGCERARHGGGAATSRNRLPGPKATLNSSMV